jgi:hypothetical protein
LARLALSSVDYGFLLLYLHCSLGYLFLFHRCYLGSSLTFSSSYLAFSYQQEWGRFPCTFVEDSRGLRLLSFGFQHSKIDSANLRGPKV